MDEIDETSYGSVALAMCWKTRIVYEDIYIELTCLHSVNVIKISIYVQNLISLEQHICKSLANERMRMQSN